MTKSWEIRNGAYSLRPMPLSIIVKSLFAGYDMFSGNVEPITTVAGFPKA